MNPLVCDRCNDRILYINETAKVFSKIQTKLAVQESSMETLKKDISEIKTDVKTLLRR
jgi:K+/H+ antiporter YhaU regulatory subunit KhtT